MWQQVLHYGLSQLVTPGRCATTRQQAAAASRETGWPGLDPVNATVGSGYKQLLSVQRMAHQQPAGHAACFSVHTCYHPYQCLSHYVSHWFVLDLPVNPYLLTFCQCMYSVNRQTQSELLQWQTEAAGTQLHRHHNHHRAATASRSVTRTVRNCKK
jgi:hypothetical protein